MKLAKLSLAAIVVAGLASSSFAADTLADAFKNGKVNGELKAYYFTIDNGAAVDADIFTTGVMLGYKTAPLYGFTLGLTAQGSSSPFADVEGKDAFKGSMYGSGAVLSEAYLAYSAGKTTAMVGRMFVDTPLISSSGSRIIKEAFEGAVVTNTDLPNTTLTAAYIQKFQSRTDGISEVGQFTKSISTNSAADANVQDGAYTLAVINNSIAGLTLTAAYANIVDVFQVGYAEALYVGKANEIGYTLGGQFYHTDLDSSFNSVDDAINLYAVKAGLSYKGINGMASYSQVSDDNTNGNVLRSGLGNGADLIYTAPVISLGAYGRDSKSYAVDVNYDVTSAANVGARYVEIDDNFKNTEKSYTAVYGAYQFDGSLKGFSLGAQYETQGKDANGEDLWLKANYKF